MPPPWNVFRSGPTALQVIIVPGREAAIEAALAPLLELLSSHESPLVGLATGATFAPFFDRLVEEEARGRLSLERLRLTHLDEYLGWDAARAGSMVREIGAGLLDRLARGIGSFHPVPAMEKNDPAAAHATMLDELGTIHLQYLGIGRNGHVAFNEPGTGFQHRTCVVGLKDETLRANSPRFQRGELPREALTMGIAGILRARALCLVALGGDKAQAVAKALEGPVGPGCPASAIRLHPRARVILDREAAGLLTANVRARPTRLPSVILKPGSLTTSGPVAVISPHPDDASISCGGLLASLPEPVQRHIVCMTTGARARVVGASSPQEVARLREAEVREEARTLEAEPHFLRCQFYDSGAFETEDVQRLLDALLQIRPAWICAPAHEDPHPTHRLARQVTDAAVAALVKRTGDPVEIWTFEGPWFQHPKDEVNALVLFSPLVEERKIAAMRAHRSQMTRVPFDEGALALARLRAITFSESHLGGTEPGHFTTLPLVEAYVRTQVAPPISK